MARRILRLQIAALPAGFAFRDPVAFSGATAPEIRTLRCVIRQWMYHYLIPIKVAQQAGIENATATEETGE